MMRKKINWLPEVRDDLLDMDRPTAQNIVQKTIEILGKNPEDGEVIGEKELETNSIMRVKIIRGYWVVYFLVNSEPIVAAILACNSELARGTQNASTRIALMRQETEDELQRLNCLMSARN
ncbi:MAG: hypothetical protein ACYCX4_17985 [Bacillota bacterium]